MHTAGIPPELCGVWCLELHSETKECVLSSKNIVSNSKLHSFRLICSRSEEPDIWITDIFLYLKIHSNVITALPTALSPAPESTQDHTKTKLSV